MRQEIAMGIIQLGSHGLRLLFQGTVVSFAMILVLICFTSLCAVNSAKTPNQGLRISGTVYGLPLASTAVVPPETARSGISPDARHTALNVDALDEIYYRRLAAWSNVCRKQVKPVTMFRLT